MKIERLIAAITEHEGWHPLGSPENTAGSRSYRHHNPGNLRKSPFEYLNLEGYSVFKNDEIGRLALHFDILKKAAGQTSTGLGPTSTLRDLIYTYAPPSDNNNTEAYIQAVVNHSGLSENLTLAELFG
jgi:hypothetical protein